MKDIKIVRPLTTGHYTTIKSISDNLFVLTSEFEDRIEYILNTILHQEKEEKVEYWFGNDDYCREGETGINSILQYLDLEGDVELNVEPEYHLNIVDKYCHDLKLDNSFPTRWLFEFFEEELIQGKQKFLDRQKEKNLVRKSKLQAIKEQKKIDISQKKQILEGLKEKLTPEELRILKLK